jgi:hypothetical protein
MRRRSLCVLVAALSSTPVLGCAMVPDTCDETLTCVPPLDASAGDATARFDSGVDSSSGSNDGALASDGDASPTNEGDAQSSDDGGPLCVTGTYCGEDAGCVDTLTSAAHCGSCTFECVAPSGGTVGCTGGQCVPTCANGDQDCDGGCFATNTDPSHCGATCGACPGPATGSGNGTCSGGICGIACTGGEGLCGDSCFTTATDPAHCGGTCKVCPSPSAGTGTAACSGGACAVDCTGATSLACSGACVDPTQLAHCGSCNPCPAAPANGQESCTSKACGFSCNAGYHSCNTSCLANTDPPATDPCVITEQFGVFVAPTGSDASAAGGTRAAPFATIAHAMQVAQTKGLRVYACAGTYTTPLTVGTNADGVNVYGGLTCPTGNSSDWKYTGAKAVVAPTTAATTALMVTGLNTGVMFTDFEFDALAAPSTSGISVAGVFIASSQGVTLTRVTIQAGDAGGGASGGTVTNWAGAQSTSGNPASGVSRGDVVSCTCLVSGQTTGGAGGDGSIALPGSGGNGTPSIPENPTGLTPKHDGAGGSGAPTGCSPGDPGASGAAASSGTRTTLQLTLTGAGLSSSGGSGAAGGIGGVAQGGGGGGGGVYSGATASGGGGGGGCGGCGGGNGTGGTPGGSSVGLASFDSAITLVDCQVTAGRGGNGGTGGTGQGAQVGGFGGVQSPPGCPGGSGGAGGIGGAGAGGAGGSSYGIAYHGSQPSQTGGTQVAAGTAGGGGMAGSGGSAQSGAMGASSAITQL